MEYIGFNYVFVRAIIECVIPGLKLQVPFFCDFLYHFSASLPAGFLQPCFQSAVTYVQKHFEVNHHLFASCLKNVVCQKLLFEFPPHSNSNFAITTGSCIALVNEPVNSCSLSKAFTFMASRTLRRALEF